MGRFIIKHSQTVKPQVKPTNAIVNDTREIEESVKKNKKSNKENIQENVMMTTAEKIEMAQEILNTPNIKKIKGDKGLIERVNTQKTILTDNNKELLVD